MEGNGRGEEKVNGKEGERWREGFGPPKNFGVPPPMQAHCRVLTVADPGLLNGRGQASKVERRRRAD